jgi:hypothetical protein
MKKTLLRNTLFHAAYIICGCLLLIAFPLGCAHLEPGGAYAPIGQQPDKAFYLADGSFDIAYSSVDAVFKFESDNRAYLWAVSPNIKHTLDKIRPLALDAATRYAKARAAYIAQPTPTGLTTLQLILTEIQKITSAAKAAIPSAAFDPLARPISPPATNTLPPLLELPAPAK